jgi:hypothetical protein
MVLEDSTNLGDDTRRFRIVDEGHSQLIRRPDVLNRGPAQMITKNVHRQSHFLKKTDLVINHFFDPDYWNRKIISEERDFEKQNKNDLHSNLVILLL